MLSYLTKKVTVRTFTMRFFSLQYLSVQYIIVDYGCNVAEQINEAYLYWLNETMSLD